MSDRAIAATRAIALFVSTAGIAFAGSDRPPPPGFLLLVAGLAAISTVAYLRIVVHMRALGTRPWAQFARVGLEGLVGGVVLAGFLALNSAGEPSIGVRPVDAAIWFMVAGTIGWLGSVALWAAALGMRRCRRQ